jgi:hypothetical protein
VRKHLGLLREATAAWSGSGPCSNAAIEGTIHEAAAATSTGGLIALVVKTLPAKTGEKLRKE